MQACYLKLNNKYVNTHRKIYNKKQIIVKNSSHTHIENVIRSKTFNKRVLVKAWCSVHGGHSAKGDGHT